MGGNICYIKTKEAAALLGLSHRTLESYRSRGGGSGLLQLRQRGALSAVRYREVGVNAAKELDLQRRAAE
ncbi:MAG: hypothetical protein OXI57_06870 [Rhodospirillales bacterium]|nr:hypothetical protein [Rhodospirillales bacterium]